MGGQNAKVSKHSAAGRMGWSISAARLWRLRVRSIWVARMQRFPSVLRWEGWAGGFQTQGCGGLGSGQYGWPECKYFQAFCGRKRAMENCRPEVVAAEGEVSTGGQNARISKHFAVGRMGWCISVAGLWRLRVRSVWVARMQ